MNVATGFPLLVFAMLAIALAGLVRRALQWRRGQAATVDWRQLALVPRRYLVDVHHVVASDPYAAKMHMAVAGGLLAGCAMAVLALLPPLQASAPWWASVALCFTVMLGGAAFVGARRVPKRPARLSGGAFMVLAVLLLGFAVAAHLAALGVLLGADGWAGTALVGLAALFGLPLALHTASGPMRHALTGALHLAAHPRPARFEDRRNFRAGDAIRDYGATALRPVDLDAARLGVETPADFAWNQLLGFDACIECGRCEVVCPAFAAGQPLNPKRLIQDLASAVDGSRTYAGSPYPNARPVAGGGGIDAAIIGPVIHPDTLWSCTTCRACVEACPMMIEHVDAIIDLRRHQTLALGAVPEKAAAALDELRAADEPGGRPLGARTDFAAGLGVPFAREGVAVDVLLWLGEGAYDLRYGRTLKALLRLLTIAGVDYAILPEERDCGDLARRLGDEATFARIANDNVATLARYSFARIVTADPHALHSLRNEYGAFGGHYEVIHHTALLDTLVADGRLPVGRIDRAVTYHDPCYLGRYNGETETPRRLIDALGMTRTEMVQHGRKSLCCGGGGGASLSDVAGDRRIPDLRMDQARATEAAIVAVACPNCSAMLEGVPGPRPDVRDIAELVLAAVDAAPVVSAVQRAAELEGAAA